MDEQRRDDLNENNERLNEPAEEIKKETASGEADAEGAPDAERDGAMAEEPREEIPADNKKRGRGKKRGKLIKIFVLCASLLALVAVIAVLLLLNSPKVLLERALSGAIDDIGDRKELAFIKNVVDNGSVAFEYKQNKGKLSGKLYLSDDEVMLEGLTVKDEKEEITLDMYASEDLSYIASEELFGEEAYGLMRGGMADGFKKSAFYDIDSEYAIKDNKLCDAISELLWIYDEEIDKDIIRDAEKLLKRYSSYLEKLIEKHAMYGIEYREERGDDGKVRLRRVVTVSVDKKALEEICDAFSEYVEDDKRLEKFAEKYGETLEYTLIAAGVPKEGDDVDDLHEILVDSVEETCDSICETVDTGIKLECVISPVSTKLYKAALISVEDDVELERIVLKSGTSGIRKSKTLSLDMDGYGRLSYSVYENDKDGFKAELKIRSDASGTTEHQKLVAIDIDREDEKFTFSLGDEAIEMSGEYDKHINGCDLKVKELKINGKSLEGFDKLNIQLDTYDPVPKPLKKSEVNSVMSLTEEDIKAIEKRFEELGKEDTKQ